MPINDNDAALRGASSPAPDVHGQAALLLVESLIHGLCENAMLSNDAALEIADRAASVQFEHAEAAEDAEGPMWQSHALLSAIAASLRIDSAG